MNARLRYIVRPTYRFCKIMLQLNVIKTLYINFRKLPFLQAIHIPIYVYGHLKIDSLKGRIIINHPIKTGMIKIGYDIDAAPLASLKSRLIIRGVLIFNGFVLIGKGSVVAVEGEMVIGNCCTIGSGCLMKSMTNISIGDNCCITYGCTIFDSNMHYVKNIETGIVKKNRAPIIIGKSCWVNAGTIIAKGVVLPDYSITARNSYLCKDYSSFGNNLFLVGSPAKILNVKIQRIFSSKEQNRLGNYFKENPNADHILLDAGLFKETSDETWFRWVI